MIELLFSTPGLIVIGLTLLFFYLNSQSSGQKEPPGPWGLPVIGHIPWLGRKMNLTLTEMAKKYGEVFQIRIGSRKIVVINYQKAVREATSLPDFNGRPDFITYKRGFGGFGLTGYPPRAKVFKKLTMKAMSVFTVDRKSELQEVAYRSVDMLMDALKDKKGEPIDPRTVMDRVIWTIMGYVSYGRYFKMYDPEVDRVFDLLPSFAKTMAFGVLVDYFPWAASILKSKMKDFYELMDTLDNYSNRMAQENIDSYDPDAVRNFSDMFKKAGDDMTPEEKDALEITDDTLKDVVGGLFGAGFGTIAAMTRFSAMYMAKWPEVQKKCQEEIDRVVGRNNYPDFDDMKRLPYTMATMTEIYRYSSMSALAITHFAVKDTWFKGYFIAEGTPVVLNLWSAHRDTHVYTDVDSFKPERFLMEDGELDKKHAETVMPFGLGARRCGGEPIARLETFLFFTVILQRCNLKEHPDHPLDPGNYFMGLGISPFPFKLVFEERKD